MRDMCSTVTIDSIEPIEGKDRIVYIGFKENGYHVIGDKSFNIGDVVVYFEVDAVLPVKPEFEFLRKRCYNDKLNGFRIKSMKMCGLYSNGLILTQKQANCTTTYKAEKDLTKILSVGKYDPEAMVAKNMKVALPKNKILRFFYKRRYYKKHLQDAFPTKLIPKSDETNIQNRKGLFETYKNTRCYVSLKMEGQSVTALLYPKLNAKKKGKYCVYSHNIKATGQIAAMADTMHLEAKLNQVYKDTGHNYAIQGERCAPDVQKGIYKNGEHFYVFSVKDLTTDIQLNREQLELFCFMYDLETVPIIKKDVILEDAFDSIKYMQDYTEESWFKVGEWPVKKYSYSKELHKPEYHRHEGVVVRGENNEFSCKVKSNEYQIAGL